MAGRGSAGAKPKKGAPPKRRAPSLAPQAVSGGGRRVQIPGDRLVGWVQRFGVRNGGLVSMTADETGVVLVGADGTTAKLAAPFAPMSIGEREPLEALLDHLLGIGTVGVLLVRAGAHSVGTARDGVVVTSSTHRAYVQGRTAAGGWSQQRYARRRGNQLDSSLEHAADVAAEVLLPALALPGGLDGLAVGGDAAAISAVLTDQRLAPLLGLPRRMFGDIPEPRRVVLDEVAERAMLIEIEVRPPAAEF